MPSTRRPEELVEAGPEVTPPQTRPGPAPPGQGGAPAQKECLLAGGALERRPPTPRPGGRPRPFRSDAEARLGRQPGET